MVCLSRPYPLKFFKSCLPQILLSPFLNTLSHTIVKDSYQTFCSLTLRNLGQFEKSRIQKLTIYSFIDKWKSLSLCDGIKYFYTVFPLDHAPNLKMRRLLQI